MKTFKIFTTSACVLWIVCLLMSCEQKITVESVVHPDGAIDRTIVFTEVDSAKVDRNMFGLHPGNGWETKVEPFLVEPNPYVKETNPPRHKHTITFHKKFTSAEEANKELDTPGDSLFRIRSVFEKKFRWFYTYVHYSDTYMAVNRFHLRKDDFFTEEDYAFINRLPAEGRSITRADSLYLEQLTEKVYEHYGASAIYEEHFSILIEAANKNNIDKHWIDSLYHHKGHMFSTILKSDGNISETPFMIQLIDTLLVSFPIEKIVSDYTTLYANVAPRERFMHDALAGKFTHIIKMPWDVVATNADSSQGTSLYWRPLNIKYLLNDYTMYAESRKMNYWAVISSGIIVAIAVLAFLKKNKRY